MPNTTNLSIELETNLDDSSKERNKSLEEIKELASTIVEGYSKIKQTIKNTIEENQKITNESGVFFYELRKVHVGMWNYYEENLVNALAKYDQKDCLEIKDIFQDKLIKSLTSIKNEIENLINEKANESTVNGINYDVSDEFVAIFDNFYFEIRRIKNLTDKDYDFFLEKINEIYEMKINYPCTNEDCKLTHRLARLRIDDDGNSKDKLDASQVDKILFGTPSPWPQISNPEKVKTKEQNSSISTITKSSDESLSSSKKSPANNANSDTSTAIAKPTYYKHLLFGEHKETIMKLITSNLQEKNLCFFNEVYSPFNTIMRNSLALLSKFLEDQEEKAGLQSFANLREVMGDGETKILDAQKKGKTTNHAVDVTFKKMFKTGKEYLQSKRIFLDGRLLIVTYLKFLYLENFHCLKTKLYTAGFKHSVGYVNPDIKDRLKCLSEDLKSYKLEFIKFRKCIDDSFIPGNKEEAERSLGYFERSYQSWEWLEKQLNECGFKNEKYIKDSIAKLIWFERIRINNIFELYDSYVNKVFNSSDSSKDKATAKAALVEFEAKNKAIEFFVNTFRGYEPREIEISSDGFRLMMPSEEKSQSKFFKPVIVNSKAENDVKSVCVNQQTSNSPTLRN